MINALKRWLKPTRSRLSRRIVFYVFVSVVVIETIILIPSTMKREKELFQQMRSVASAQIEVLMFSTSSDDCRAAPKSSVEPSTTSTAK
jgi:hypothetical protein